jgi:hypothetical protein
MPPLRVVAFVSITPDAGELCPEPGQRTPLAVAPGLPARLGIR